MSRLALAAAAGGAAAAAVAALALAQRSKKPSARVIVAVSGTIQDGFELRKNIDYRADGECVEAVLLGYGVVRGVKMFFDIKDVNCREYDPATPHRVNPAMVLTGNHLDANQYALYLVDERACLNALLGEPRLLTMVPDAVRVELDDPSTSPEVAALARAFIAADGKSNTSACAVLAVVPCYQSKSFVPAPPVEERPDGTRLTSFRRSLAAFAGLEGDLATPGTKAWNDKVASALEAKRQAIAAGKVFQPPAVEKDDSLYGTDPATARLSRRLTVAQFNDMAAAAGVSLRVK